MEKMKDKDILISIVDLITEKNELLNKIEGMNRKCESKIVDSHMTSLEEKIYKIGLQHLYDEGFDKSTYISKAWDEEKYPSFEKWIANHIDLKKDLQEISQREFIDMFYEKLKNHYDKVLNKQLEKDNQNE